MKVTTVEEIAKLAGVSKATVSRVLNEKTEGVSEATRERVKKIIQDVGYTNEHFRFPANPIKMGCIALVIPDITNPFFADIVKAVEKRAREYNFTVIIANTDFSEKAELRCISNLVLKKVDGILLIPVGAHSHTEHLIPEKYGIPLILLDRKFVDEPRWVGAYVDNSYAVFRSCEMLFQHGSRRVAMLSTRSNVSTALERIEGYRAALEHYQLPFLPELLKYGDYTVQDGYNAVLDLERAGTKFDAIFASNDLMALGALRALAEFSYQVPQEVEVIGFDNILYSQYCEPPLTTIQQPTLSLGAIAFDMLVKKINGEQITESIRLLPKILIRKSTR